MAEMSALAETVGVSRVYPRAGHSLIALSDVSVRLNPGSFTAIVGRSGSGKSTLLNLLGCLDVPSRGQVRVAGQDVSALDDESMSRLRNRHIGFLFQSFNLIPRMTVRENIETALIYSDRPESEWTGRIEHFLMQYALTETHTKTLDIEFNRVLCYFL